MASKFPKTDIRFCDTRGAGGITVRGFELQCDEDGCIEGPANLAKDIVSHGFYPEGSPEFAAFMEKRKTARPATGKKAA